MTGLPTPQICLLAADDTNLLWILRIAVAASGNTSAAAWHPLLPDCSFVALGPTGTAGNEIFTLDQNNNLNRLWSDPLSLAWRDFPVHQPTFPGVTTEPYYIAQYTTEFTVSDTSQLASGVPLGNYAVTLTAAENVMVSITGVAYELGPQLAPVSLTTDYRGKVTVSTPALGLHTPQLSFTAGPQTCTVYPPQNIQSQLGAVQGSDLAAAQSKTSWNATEPLVTDDQNVNSVATALGNTIQVKTAKQINGGTVLPPSLDASLPLHQALRQARAACLLGPDGRPAALGGFWDDLLHDIEDLFQAIRKAIVVVTDVVVDVGQGIFQFTASLAGVVSQVIQFVINTIHDVVAALEAAFNWIVSEISKVIDWLKEIFDWTNILYVKSVLEAYFNQFMNNTIASLSGDNLSALTSYVSAAFGALANDIAGFFDKIGSLPNAGDSVSNQPAMQTSTTVGSTALQQDKSSQGYASNQVKSNYVHTQTNTYIAQGGTIGTAGGGSASDRLQDINNLWNAVETVLEQVGNDILNDFVTNLQNMQPSGLFGNTFAVIVDIFETIVEALVQFLGDLINAVLNLASDALAWLQTALTTPLNIPGLSWLYQALTGSPLTILDLCCLVFAFPVTVIYVSLNGNPQDFTMPGGQSWPSIQNLPPTGATLRRGPRRAPRSGAPGDVTKEVLGALFALDYLYYTGLDAGCDFLAFWQQTAPTGTGEVVKIVSFLNIVASFFGQGIDAPYDLFQGEETWTTAESLEVAAWGANFAPLLSNSVALFAGGKIAEFWGNAGVLLTTFLGLGGVAVSLGALVYVSEDDASASNILGAVSDLVSYFPMFGKLLLTIAEDTEGVSVAVLMAIDVVCDIATGALGCASMETS